MDSLEAALNEELEVREAVAFVVVGTRFDPTIRYCEFALEESATVDGTADRPRITGGGHGPHIAERNRETVALAFDGDAWVAKFSTSASSHPTDALAMKLADSSETGTVLAPRHIPHDSALYLEEAGFELASSAVVSRTRATKTERELDRIASAQATATAGVRRAGTALSSTMIDDGTLVLEGEPLTPARLRTLVDEEIVSAGGLPGANTIVNPDPEHNPSTLEEQAGSSSTADPLRADEPIVVQTAPCGPGGYHGGLTRTFVVDGDGGRERRAHVGVTQSFRSAAAMLTADSESVTAVEADLEAEVRAFGFEEPDAVQTRVSGVGLEPVEPPLEGGDRIESGSVVRLESAARVDDGSWLRIADVLVKPDGEQRAAYLEGPSRSLEPAAMVER
ncbi:M24 family metallopeptidase [Natronorubrum daqingense]|uniref:M24 family metallopeptidase n=1 Tax=Natronorubrum daqingense TaxID=588898 RepID=UPI001F453FD3|nr:M24 family metallopeptidase [Natronorubrum daqingense]